MNRLAVIYPKAIGDFMFVLPALHTIRRAFPDLYIVLVVKEKQAPLALPQKGTLCDEVLILGRGLGWLDVRRRLADCRVDTVVDMVGNDQSGLLMCCRRGRRMRPHRVDCKGICAAYTPWAESLPPMQPHLHRVEALLEFARAIGATHPLYSFRLEFPQRAIDACERMIGQYALRSGPVVALNLGASRDSKRWPADCFMSLTRELVGRGMRVALMGAPQFKADNDYDRKTIEQFRAHGVVDDERCIDLVTAGDNMGQELHLQRDAYFLRYADVAEVVVGNDTGAMHIAGSVGEDARNKTVSLFGPTNWGRYAPFDPSHDYPDEPYGQWNRVLCADVSCVPHGDQEACPAYRRGCEHKQCMKALQPERVVECVMEMVKA